MSEHLLLFATLLAGAGSAAAILLLFHLRRPSKRILSAADVAASILCEVSLRGGASLESALSAAERLSGGSVGEGRIDIPTWAARYRELKGENGSRELLLLATRGAVARSALLSREQYEALVQLSFSLGFRADALARLRLELGFEFVDPAGDRYRNA